MQTLVGKSQQTVTGCQTRRSREGVPWREYRWALALVTLPFAVLFELCFFLYGRCLRAEPVPQSTVDAIPDKAIVFLFHTEIYGALCTWELYWRLFGKGAVLGNHSFLSYVWSLGMYVKGFRMIRFHPNSGRRVLGDIVQQLKTEVPGRFGLRTDSGGPYEVVRKSLVLMSLQSGRPLVPMRQRYDRAWRIKKHWIPKPFAKARTVIGRPIETSELEGLSLEAARDLVQARIDALQD